MPKPDSCTSMLSCSHAKVRQLMRRFTTHYDSVLVEAGLKTTQYSLMTNLAKLQAVRPAELASLMKMTPSTLSRNLHVLIEAGYVAMEPGQDGRSRLVRLTDAGRHKRRETQELWNKAQHSLHDKLGVARVDALHALIDDTLAILDSR